MPLDIARSRAMPSEILKHTPYWVFILFFVLLAVGYFLSRERAISRRQISILPLAMIALSFYGVVSAFGVAPISLIFWGSGVGITAGLVARLATPVGVRFSTQTQVFSVPGSWLPLAFMMAIFFTKYFVAVIQARQLPIANDSVFVGSVSFCYGFFSGVFLGRAFVIWRFLARTMKEMSDRTLHADAP